MQLGEPGDRNIMISGRNLSKDEIEEIWTIDRSEVIEAVYYYENSMLVLKREHYTMRGWPPGEAERYTPVLEACYDQGGWFYGLYDNHSLVGVAVLESRFIGMPRDQLQLKFLHISSLYRGQGLGKQLFDIAVSEAIQRGAKHLYISATPSENTIHFYIHLGCKINPEPDPDLFALEPEDIHLVYDLG
jgi:GNAT superfamily N-acetyltransferase